VTARAAEAGPGSIVLSGDSAGGGLALALALSMRDERQAPPAGCILLSPWLDLGRDRRADPVLVRRDVLLDPACSPRPTAPSPKPPGSPPG
jgi:acetyl esterase/lipase